MSRREPGPILAWIALLVAVLWLSLRGFGSFQLGIYQDDAIYTVLARSLAGGEVFGMINEPQVGPPPFGFGFPLLLTPAVRLFPQTLEGLSAVSLAATLLNLSLLFWGWPLLGSGTSRWWGLGIAALYGLSPTVVGQTRLVMSEPAYTTLALTACLLGEAAMRRTRPRALLAGLGAVVALAVFTRATGVALAAAVGLRFLFIGRWRDLGWIAAGGVGLLAMVLLATPVEPRHVLPARYLEELSHTPAENPVVALKARDGWGRWTASIADYVQHRIRRSVIPIGTGSRELALAEWLGIPSLPYALGTAVAALVAFGAWRTFAEGALCPTLLLFESLHLALLLLWPWSSTRLLYPIQALLSFQLVYGVAAASGWAARRFAPADRLRAGVAVALTSLLALLSFYVSLGVADSRTMTRDLDLGSTWLAANSEPNAIVMAHHPASIYLRAQRRTVDVPQPLTADAVQRRLEEGLGWVLVAPELRWGESATAIDAEQQQLLDLLAASARLELAYQSEGDLVRVYRVVR